MKESQEEVPGLRKRQGREDLESSDGDNLSEEEEDLLPRRPTPEEYKAGKLKD